MMGSGVLDSLFDDRKRSFFFFFIAGYSSVGIMENWDPNKLIATIK